MPRMTSIDMRVFGARVREVRKEKEMSQQDLAEALQTHQGWISELENGRQRGLAADTVRRLCLALECSADYLLDLPMAAPRRKARRKAAASSTP